MLTVSELAPSGRALGRLPDGRVVFIDGVLPGDQVELTEVRDHGRWLEATGQIVTPAAERRAVPCTHQAACGGCPLMPLPEERQRALKQELVRTAFRRTAGVDPGLPPIHSAGPTLGYRNRIRLHVGPAGALGYFRPGSRELLPIDRCLVAAAPLASALTRVAEELAAREGAGLAGLELRLGADDQVGVALFPRRPRRTQRGRRRRSRAGGAQRREGRTGRGQPQVDPRLPDLERALRAAGLVVGGRARLPLALPGGAHIELPLTAFVQVNHDINELIRGRLRAAAEGFADHLELCAGWGNLSLALRDLPGLAIESHPGAVAAGRSLGLSQLTRGDAAALVAEWTQAGRSADLVVLDPPRAGAPWLTGCAPLIGRRLVYVSCDPVTLARDLRPLLEGGFTLTSLELFDMFPQTHHVETVAILDRQPSRLSQEGRS